MVTAVGRGYFVLSPGAEAALSFIRAHGAEIRFRDLRQWFWREWLGDAARAEGV